MWFRFLIFSVDMSRYKLRSVCIHSILLLSMNMWSPSVFKLLCIILLCTYVYKCLFKTLMSVGIHPEADLLCHMLILFSVFWKPPYWFLQKLYHLTDGAQWFQFSHLHLPLLFSIFNSIHPNKWSGVVLNLKNKNRN